MGRHSIGIVDRVYATKSLQHGLHVVYLRNLKDKPVLHNVVSGCLNLCPHNIHSTFAEGARYVLQKMAPVVTFHLNLYPKRGGRARLPGDVRKPLGVLRERFHIGTIAAMHSHTLAKGDIADYIIPVSYTHLRAHKTKANLVCRLLLEKKKKKKNKKKKNKKQKKNKTKKQKKKKTH